MKITPYKKNGRTYYKFQIRLGEKVTSRAGFKSRNEAIATYVNLQENYEDELRGNIEYKKVYKDYMAVYKTTVKESTYNKTLEIFRIHILPVFGNKKIYDITPQMCQTFAINLADLVKGKLIFNYAKKVLNFAMTNKLINENPFNNVILPKFKKSQDKFNFLSAEEAHMVIGYYDGNPYWHTLFRLMIYTGMRRGEVLALTWKDIDFKRSEISINKSLTIGKDKKVILATPKTESSIRVIDIDDETMLELKKYKLLSTNNLLFPNRKGGFSRLSNIADKLNQACNNLDIKKVRVHDLRHTHASLLFDSGADIKYIQHRLGHSKIETTLNIYVHVTKDKKEENLINFSDYMKRKKDSLEHKQNQKQA